MKYKHTWISCVLLFATITSFCQVKKYLYYFDQELNPAEKAKSIFSGLGMYENDLMKLVIYNTSDKSLLLTEHFTDSSLQVREGLFQSYYKNVSIEAEGNYVKGKKEGLWQRWD